MQGLQALPEKNQLLKHRIILNMIAY
jgi:hypothetical protein